MKVRKFAGINSQPGERCSTANPVAVSPKHRFIRFFERRLTQPQPVDLGIVQGIFSENSLTQDTRFLRVADKPQSASKERLWRLFQAFLRGKILFQSVPLHAK